MKKILIIIIFLISISVSDVYADYYADVYDVEDSVFHTQTIEDINYLLKQEGNFVVLFGGAGDANTKTALPIINNVAKTLGITDIYNFDFNLDGASANIADSSSQYANYYTDIVKKLPQIESIFADGDTVTSTLSKQTVPKIITPFLFVYNKNDGIVAYANYTAENYEALVNETLRPYVDDFAVIDNFDYIAGAFNAARGSREPLIFTDDEKETFTLKHVTYHEFKNLLDQDETNVFLIGGSWCANTRASIKYINEYAAANHVENVYIFDTKLDAGVPATGVYTDTNLQIRETGHPLAGLYVDAVNTYLTNITTEYDPESVFVASNGKKAAKLQAPFLFVYNKNLRDSRYNKAPIYGSIELMYEWKNMQSGNDYDTYTSALTDLFARLTEYDSTLINKEKPNVTYVAPTDGSNGKIVGLTRELEYRLPKESNWIVAENSEITGLSEGVKYYVRHRARAGLNIAGDTKIVTLYRDGGDANYNAPTIKPAPVLRIDSPTSETAEDGRIFGITIDMEYRLPDEEGWTTATINEIRGLKNGDVYLFRYFAVEGYSEASDIAEITIEDGHEDEEEENNGGGNGGGKKDEDDCDPATTGGGGAIAVTPELTQKTDKDGITTVIIPDKYLTITSEVKIEVPENCSKIIVEFPANSTQSASIVSRLGIISVGNTSRNITFERQGSTYVYTGNQATITVPYTLKKAESKNEIVIYGDDKILNGRYNEITETVTFRTTDAKAYEIRQNKVDFSDVKNSDWFVDAVTFLSARKVINGTDSTHFSPRENLTRGQFITLLLKAYNIEPTIIKDNFTDGGNAYYTPYIAYAKANKLTNGVGNNLFMPDEAITREDLFTLLNKTLELLGKKPTSNEKAITFSDAQSISTYAADAVNALSSAGIIKGDNGKVKPKESTTRAEFTQILYNLTKEAL